MLVRLRRTDHTDRSDHDHKIDFSDTYTEHAEERSISLPGLKLRCQFTGELSDFPKTWDQ